MKFHKLENVGKYNGKTLTYPNGLSCSKYGYYFSSLRTIANNYWFLLYYT